MPRLLQKLAIVLLPALLLVPAGTAQTRLKSGFNVFSTQQDVEIGQKASAEAEQQLPLLRDDRVEDFVEALGQRLVQHAPGPDFPYTFKVVDASDLNAFALPGGPVYLNRGIIEAARNEGEVAGVLAHEISHVALRHGTHNVSKAYLAEAGLSVLGGLLGGDKADSDLAKAVGGFGLNALFLRYSRDAETQADVAASQMLAGAGFSPMDMVTFFQLLEGTHKTRSANWLSSHPAPARRADRVTQEMTLIRAPTASPPSSRAYLDAKARLARLPAARTTEQLVASGSRTPAPSGTTTRTPTRRGEAIRVDVEPPSTRWKAYQDRTGLFRISHPDNWDVTSDRDGLGVTMTATGGVARVGQRNEILVGAIVDHYEPFGTRRRPTQVVGEDTSQDDATDDLIETVMQSHPHLKPMRNSARRFRLPEGEQGLTVTLSGTSPHTGLRERVVVLTRQLDDEHLMYILFVTPEELAAEYRPVLDSMLRSLRVDDHRHAD